MKLHDILPEDRAKIERLYDYVHGKPVEISDQEKKILDRVNFADDQLRSRKTDRVVIELLRRKFPEISLSTARNDLITAKYLFNALSLLDKSYGLQLLLAMNLQMLDKAMLEGDAKNGNALMKTRMELLKMIEQTEEPFDPSKAQSNTYILNLTMTGGRPKNIDLEKIHELPESEYKIIEQQIHSDLIPENIIELLQGRTSNNE